MHFNIDFYFNFGRVYRDNKYYEHGELKKMKLKTVGWGAIYDETRMGDNGDGSYLTSCMTDHNGPRPYNFQPCILPGVIT